MNKKIGIVGWKTGDNSFGSTIAYMHLLSFYGDVMILPPTNTIFDLDLLVLPGGKDALSSHYSEAPSFYNSDPDVMKEHFYMNNLKQYVEKETPIFGICLGFQQLNIFFGGKLTQNCGHPYSEKSRAELVHECKFSSHYATLKNKLVEGKKFEVNSMHHQGLNDREDLAPDFRVMLTHDGIVEAAEHKYLPIAGVQWHPEELFDPVSLYLIEKLLNHATTKGSTRKPEELTTS